MKQQEVFRKTGAIIKELNEQYEYLQNTADNLNDLELELFVANTHFLKDHAEILRKLNLQKEQLQHTLPPHIEEKKQPETIRVQPEPQKPVVEEIKKAITYEPKYFEPLVQQVKPIITDRAWSKPDPEKTAQPEPVKLDITPVNEETPAPEIDLHTGSDTDSYSFEREEPETIRHELILDEAEDWDEEEEVVPVVTADKTRKFPEVTMENILDGEITAADDETAEPNIVPTNPEPVIDNTPKVKAEEPAEAQKVLTLNQKMSAQLRGDQISSAEPAEAPVKDIKTIISLNDKLLFVKDLFNGYSLAYSEAIEIVNRFSSFEEADRFLKTNYVTKNNWEGKKATADKFYALLKRRYA
ncbi:hypothetical protein [Mucilaginibacter sp. AK015]|uniref:hypothetical protein n=1 Tax=Mucilaginibacter sp. AK015 TaxID=2723072 RepID=UPI0016126E1B|nr:hypothetical protein [Mucilaginibacter sp. AK015]MBB5397523.1 hypothetical protein [Mucilaginibacter sp. AK015]